MSLVYGYIFEWDGLKENENVSNSNRFAEAFLSIKAFKSLDDRKLARARRWSVYHFFSPKPLLGEEPHQVGMGHDYVYKAYVRVNEKTGTLVIAGSRFTITEEVVRTFNTYVRPSLQRKVINIKTLSDHLLERGGEKRFAVTHLTADVPGHGTAVASISLTGDDIGGADFLVEERAGFTMRQVGVRPVDHRSECGRFGSVGSVQFRTDLRRCRSPRFRSRRRRGRTATSRRDRRLRDRPALASSAQLVRAGGPRPSRAARVAHRLIRLDRAAPRMDAGPDEARRVARPRLIPRRPPPKVSCSRQGRSDHLQLPLDQRHQPRLQPESGQAALPPKQT